ncbi:MAG: chemotaxis protein CheA [Candidatus Heimdallarchaeota archaeon]
MPELDEYEALFLSELQEYIESLKTLVPELRKEQSNIPVAAETQRIVHSIKGMAGIMGYQALTEVSQTLESHLNEEISNGQVSSKLLRPLSIFPNKLETFAQVLAAGEDVSAVDMSELLKEVATIESILPTTDRQLEILIKFDSQAKMKNLRAFMIIQALESAGNVLSSIPTKDQLEADAVFEVLTIDLKTNEGEDEIRRRIFAVLENSDEVNISINYGSVDAEVTEEEDVSQLMPTRDAQTVRVSMKDLDDVMNLLGELMILRGSLSAFGDTAVGSQADSLARIDTVIFALQEKFLGMRMVSLEHVLSQFPRLVRDIAKVNGKKIDLQIVGNQIELDRSVIDPVNEILLHLVRNAASHGIESPERRTPLGKPEDGRIRIIARQERDGVIVEVEDDGVGIDMDALQRQAVAMGLSQADQTLSREDLTRILFSSGKMSQKTAGRDYGLSLVNRKLEEINATLEMRTKKGVGTNFTIKLPLTIAIQQALLVEVNQQKFALPLNNVQTVLLVERDKIITQANRKAIVLRGELIPVIKLSHTLQLGAAGQDGFELEDKEIIVIWEKGVHKLGLSVENLLGQRDIVIKQLDAITSSVQGFSGASIIDEGEIVLILDPLAISNVYT